MNEPLTTTNARRPGYRVWFLLDGLVTGVNAVAYLALPQILPELLGSTPATFVTAGLILAVVTVGLLAVAWARPELGALAGVLIAVNVIWALGSFVVALANPLSLSTIGIVWTVVQGLIVSAFAIFQVRARARYRRGLRS